MLRHKWRIAAGLAAALCLPTLMGGCGGGLMGSMLTITGAAALLPDDWSAHGGWVTILADISGYSTVQKVMALVKKRDSADLAQVELTLDMDGKYRGAYNADANDDYVPEAYSVVVTATDTAGNSAQSDPVEFEVPPAEEAVAAE